MRPCLQPWGCVVLLLAPFRRTTALMRTPLPSHAPSAHALHAHTRTTQTNTRTHAHTRARAHAHTHMHTHTSEVTCTARCEQLHAAHPLPRSCRATGNPWCSRRRRRAQWWRLVAQPQWLASSATPLILASTQRRWRLRLLPRLGCRRRRARCWSASTSTRCVPWQCHTHKPFVCVRVCVGGWACLWEWLDGRAASASTRQCPGPGLWCQI